VFDHRMDCGRFFRPRRSAVNFAQASKPSAHPTGQAKKVSSTEATISTDRLLIEAWDKWSPSPDKFSVISFQLSVSMVAITYVKSDIEVLL
ncbi:MAG TPA: hypothetical protein VK780_06720, partial [Thermoanaerobaculia bacterium]|nr:hypothetical protein [Thermoanaerobaculia bacterium]